MSCVYKDSLVPVFLSIDLLLLRICLVGKLTIKSTNELEPEVCRFMLLIMIRKVNEEFEEYTDVGTQVSNTLSVTSENQQSDIHAHCL